MSRLFVQHWIASLGARWRRRGSPAEFEGAEVKGVEVVVEG